MPAWPPPAAAGSWPGGGPRAASVLSADGPPVRSDQRFGRSRRIRHRRDYLAIYKLALKFDTPLFVLYVRPAGGPDSRLGITTSRKIGSAVVRNRVKRRFRELFRRHRAGLPQPLDLVLNARRAAVTAERAELERVFGQAVQRAVLAVGACPDGA